MYAILVMDAYPGLLSHGRAVSMALAKAIKLPCDTTPDSIFFPCPCQLFFFFFFKIHRLHMHSIFTISTLILLLPCIQDFLLPRSKAQHA